MRPRLIRGLPGGYDDRVLYFAYGSNMSAAQMAERCPGARLVGTAKLTGYRLAFNRQSERWAGRVASVVAEEGAETWGALWEVTGEHLESLDRWEGVAVGAYRRHEVLVVRGETTVGAVAYVVCSPGEEGPPAPAYLRVLREAARDLGFDDAYLPEHGARPPGTAGR